MFGVNVFLIDESGKCPNVFVMGPIKEAHRKK
jgi:hypothetical protein